MSELRARRLTCAEVVDLLTQYLEGALAPIEHARVEEHLATCPDCMAYVERLRTTIGLVGRLREDELPEHVLDGLRGRFAAGTRAERAAADGPPRRARIAGSQPSTAAAAAGVSLRRLWLPRSLTTCDRGPGGGMPNGSRSPWTTSTGTRRPRARAGGRARRARRARGGCSGNARHSTPTAPVAAAVRHATRAPEERPPETSGSPRARPRAAARAPRSRPRRAARPAPASGGRRRGRAARRARR